jgi:hypothetical protein
VGVGMGVGVEVHLPAWGPLAPAPQVCMCGLRCVGCAAWVGVWVGGGGGLWHTPGHNEDGGGIISILRPVDTIKSATDRPGSALPRTHKVPDPGPPTAGRPCTVNEVDNDKEEEEDTHSRAGGGKRRPPRGSDQAVKGGRGGSRHPGGASPATPSVVTAGGAGAGVPAGASASSGSSVAPVSPGANGVVFIDDKSHAKPAPRVKSMDDMVCWGGVCVGRGTSFGGYVGCVCWWVGVGCVCGGGYAGCVCGGGGGKPHPHTWLHTVLVVPPTLVNQEYVIDHEPTAFYKEFHGGEIMEYGILARGVDKWEFDIFEWAATVPRPLAILTMVLMNRMGLVITTGRGERRHGSVLVAWETACKYFQVRGSGGNGVFSPSPPPTTTGPVCAGDQPRAKHFCPFFHFPLLVCPCCT